MPVWSFEAGLDSEVGPWYIKEEMLAAKDYSSRFCLSVCLSVCYCSLSCHAKSRYVPMWLKILDLWIWLNCFVWKLRWENFFLAELAQSALRTTNVSPVWHIRRESLCLLDCTKGLLHKTLIHPSGDTCCSRTNLVQLMPIIGMRLGAFIDILHPIVRQNTKHVCTYFMCANIVYTAIVFKDKRSAQRVAILHVHTYVHTMHTCVRTYISHSTIHTYVHQPYCFFEAAASKRWRPSCCNC